MIRSRVSFRAAVAAAVTILILTADGRSSQVRAAAGRMPTAQSCSASFADRVGDAITGDDGGSYVNGIAGVQCEVFEAASGDITLYLTASGRRATRFINFNYSDKVEGSGPTGTLEDSSTQAGFQEVATLPSGGSGEFTGGFTTSIGRFAFNPGNWPGSSLLTVTRTSATDWTIEAGGAAVAVLSQSLKRQGTVDVGHYLMPFELDIHCPSCS